MIAEALARDLSMPRAPQGLEELGRLADLRAQCPGPSIGLLDLRIRRVPGGDQRWPQGELQVELLLYPRRSFRKASGAGATMFYVEHDGVVNGMRTMQFWLERSPTKVLQFTLNCKDGNVDARRQELADIVASVRWP
jgi:hypothetical protein